MQRMESMKLETWKFSFMQKESNPDRFATVKLSSLTIRHYYSIKIALVARYTGIFRYLPARLLGLKPNLSAQLGL